MHLKIDRPVCMQEYVRVRTTSGRKDIGTHIVMGGLFSLLKPYFVSQTCQLLELLNVTAMGILSMGMKTCLWIIWIIYPLVHYLYIISLIGTLVYVQTLCHHRKVEINNSREYWWNMNHIIIFYLSLFVCYFTISEYWMCKWNGR